MAPYELETRLAPGEVWDRADAFFSEKALGLRRRDHGPRQRSWQGGTVFLTVHDVESGSRVELATTEWDTQVREFMGRLPKKRLPFL